MNTKEILDYLNRDPECSKMFYGVYPADKISNFRSLPALIVCNTDTSCKRGEHWIDLYIDKNRRGEYFDSFGRCPFEQFKIFLDKNCVEWIWNEIQIQSAISKLCGHYCIFYCLYRSRGLDVRKIVRMFTKDTGLNASIVYNFVCKL